ncbi:squalene/phytoene synthase family protein [bacterium]|nr:squalene/phytoene synthase family protein [bacterium]
MDLLRNKRRLPWAVRLASTALPADKRRQAAEIHDHCLRVDGRMKAAFARGGIEFRNAMQAQLRELTDLFAEGHPKDPALHPLREVIDRHELPKRDFSAIIDGCNQAILQRDFSDWHQLEAALHQSAATPAAMIARVLGATSDPARIAAQNLGKAIRYSDMLLDITAALDDGRVPFPVIDMHDFEVDPNTLATRDFTPAFRRLVEHQVERLRRLLSEPHEALDEFPDDGCRHFVRVILAWQTSLLDRIEAADYNLFQDSIALGTWDSIRMAFTGGKKS